MPDDNSTDSAATQAVADETDTAAADAAQEVAEDADTDATDESGLDEKAKAALDKARREARNLRQRLKELEPAAKKLREIQDKDKSESQKLTDLLAEANKTIATFELREAQAAAASAAGLPASMAQFITASDPDEAKAQAKQLADFAKAGSAQADFKQGARKVTPTQPTGDAWLRRMAGRQ
jgi:DNA repair exonuclease SbcCD ATPase subunit